MLRHVFTARLAAYSLRKYGLLTTLRGCARLVTCFARPYGSPADAIGFANTRRPHFDELKHWYDGYLVEDKHVYNPSSVAKAFVNKKCDLYWPQTESFESIRNYIAMNFDGLKDRIIRMLDGEFVPIDVASFNNTMHELNDANDVLNLLIHIGYLGYDERSQCAFIPNEEVRSLLQSAARSCGWEEVMKAIDQSEKFMKALLAKNTEKVAEILQRVHSDVTSILKYNDENSLSCAIGFAAYTARRNYTVIREMPAGEVFTDIVMIPRQDRSVPAVILELKWDHDEESAIDQIKNKHYPDSLRHYQGNMLLVGVNYDKADKKHTCLIEDDVK